MRGYRNRILVTTGLFLCFLTLSSLQAVLPSPSAITTIGASGAIIYSGIPPAPPSSGYFAYTGFEGVSIGTRWTGSVIPWNYWDDGGYPETWWQNTEGSSRWGEIVSSAPDGSRAPNGGTRVLQMSSRAPPSGKRIEWKPTHLDEHTDIAYWDWYLSYWLYIPTQQGDTSWWCHYEFKEQESGWGAASISDAMIMLQKSYSNLWSEDTTHWRICVLFPALGAAPRRGMSYKIYKTSYSGETLYDGSSGWSPQYATGPPTINPHEVPHDRWFKMEIYLKRRYDKTGAFYVWLTDPKYPDWADGKLLFGAENVQTHYYAYPVNGDMPIVKNYGWWGDAYVDEVYIYNYNPRED